jgi:hypothetical protein
MRMASFSTEEPPVAIDNLELREYVTALRRRIEVQNDLASSLVRQQQDLMQKMHNLQDEVDKLSLDLGLREGNAGPLAGS